MPTMPKAEIGEPEEKKPGAIFQAELKAVAVKPDGLEVKLRTEFYDSAIVQALAQLMSERTLVVNIRPLVEQMTLTFNAKEPEWLKAAGEE